MNFRHLQKLSVSCNYNTLHRAARFLSPTHQTISTVPGPAKSNPSPCVTKCLQSRSLSLPKTSEPCSFIRNVSRTNSVRQLSRPGTAKLSSGTRNNSKVTLNGRLSRGFKFGRNETKTRNKPSFTTFTGRRIPTKRNKHTEEVKIEKITTDSPKTLLTVDNPSDQQQRYYSTNRTRIPLGPFKKRSKGPSVTVTKPKSCVFSPHKKIRVPAKNPEKPLVSRVSPRQPCTKKPQSPPHFSRRIEKKSTTPQPQQVREDISINKNSFRPPKCTSYKDEVFVEHIKEVVTRTVTKISEEEYLAAISSPPQIKHEGEYYRKLLLNKENSKEIDIKTDASHENNITIEYKKRISTTSTNKSENENVRLPEKSVKPEKKDKGTEIPTAIYQLEEQEKSAKPKKKYKYEKIVVIIPPKNIESKENLKVLATSKKEETNTEIQTKTNSIEQNTEIYYDALDWDFQYAENVSNELEKKFNLEQTPIIEELEEKIKAIDKEDYFYLKNSKPATDKLDEDLGPQHLETKQDSKLSKHPWEMSPFDFNSKLYKLNSESKNLDPINDNIINIEKLEVKARKITADNKQNLEFPEEIEETTNNTYKLKLCEYKPKVNTEMTNSLHFEEFYPWKSYEKNQEFVTTHNAVTAKSVKLHFKDGYPWTSNNKNQESYNRQNADTAITKENYNNTYKKYEAKEENLRLYQDSASRRQFEDAFVKTFIAGKSITSSFTKTNTACKNLEMFTKDATKCVDPKEKRSFQASDNAGKTETKALVPFTGKKDETIKKPLGILHVTVNVSPLKEPTLETLFLKPKAIMSKILRFEEYKKQFLEFNSKKPLELEPKKSIGSLTVLLNPLKKTQAIQDFNELSKIEKICKEELKALQSLNQDSTPDNVIKLSHEDSQSNQNINRALLEEENPFRLLFEDSSEKSSTHSKNVQTTVDKDWSQIEQEAKKTVEEIEKSNTSVVNNNYQIIKQLNSITDLQSKAVKNLEENYKHSTKDQLEIKKSDISSMVEEKNSHIIRKPRIIKTIIIQCRKSSQCSTAHTFIRRQGEKKTNLEYLNQQKPASFSTCDKDKCKKYEPTKDDPFGRKKPDPYRHKQRKMCPKPKPIDLRINMKASDCDKCPDFKDERSPCKKPDPCNDPCKKTSPCKPDPCKKKSSCEPDPCKKKSSCEPDPCKKKSSCEPDPCKKKFNPCKGSGAPKKSPCKQDPCKKKSQTSCKQDRCKKKSRSPCRPDPCKKKSESSCKQDPCKKKSESSCKQDPCKKKSESSCKQDPCKKKSESSCKQDPCKKKSESSCKQDPCKKISESSCKQDPCKTKSESSCKQDPCKKKSESSCNQDPCKKKSESSCKQDPCKKKSESSCKQDPCKKKSKSPCGKSKKGSPCKGAPKKTAVKRGIKHCSRNKLCSKKPCKPQKKKKSTCDPCAKFRKREKKKCVCSKSSASSCKKSRKSSPCSPSKKKPTCSPCKKKPSNPCKKRAARPCKRKPSKCSRKSSLKDKFMEMCKGPNTKSKIQTELEDPCILPKNKAKEKQKNSCKKSREASPCSKTRTASPCKKAKEEIPCKMKKSKQNVQKKKRSAKVLPKPVCGKPETKETKPTQPKKTKPDCCKKPGSGSGSSSGSKCSCRPSASKMSCKSNRPTFAAYKPGPKNVSAVCCSRHTQGWLSNKVPCKSSSSLASRERSKKLKLPSPNCTSAPGSGNTSNLRCCGRKTKGKSNQPTSILPGGPPMCGEIIIYRQIELEECDPKTGQKIVKKTEKKMKGAVVLPPPTNCGKIPEISRTTTKKKIKCKIDVTKKPEKKSSTCSTSKKSYCTKSSCKSECNCETTSINKCETKSKSCPKCEAEKQTVCRCDTNPKPASKSQFKYDPNCNPEECSFKCKTEMSSSEFSSRTCLPSPIPQVIPPCPPQPKTPTSDSPSRLGRCKNSKSNPNLYTRDDVQKYETPYRSPKIYTVHNIQCRVLGPKLVKDSFSRICRMKPGHGKCTESDDKKIVCNDSKKCSDPAKIEVDEKYIEEVEEMIETKQCLSYQAMKHIPCVSPTVKQKKPRYLEILKRLQSKPATPEAYDPCKKRSGSPTKNTCCNPKQKSSVCDK